MATLTYIGKQAKSYLIPAHSHADWEIICCTHGSGEINLHDGKNLRYGGGDILVIPPGVRHTNSSETGFKNIHVNISGWVAPFKAFFKVADVNNAVGQLLRQLILASVSEMKNKNVVLQNYVDLLLNLITGMIDIGHQSEYVEKLKNKLIENFGDGDFDTAAYMRTLPLTPEYLRKLFIKEMGVSPLQFLTRIRIENAKKLLSAIPSNRLKVDAVAKMSGFSDSLYFSRLFKKHLGVSPSDYRKHTTPPLG